jgi:ankyrin repeat protein
MSSADCLVARAVPIPKSTELLEDNEKSFSKSKDAVDSLVNNLNDLNLADKNATPTTVKKPSPKSSTGSQRTEPVTSPADFITFQSMRSSALARKTNTTSKVSRDCGNLMADLLCFNEESQEQKDQAKKLETEKAEQKKQIDEKKLDNEEKPSIKVEKTESEKTSDKKDDAKEPEKEKTEGKSEENDLLTRGPDRVVRAPVSYQPYPQSRGYGTALQSGVADPSAYNSCSYAYDCGVNYYSNDGREYLSTSSTPDTVNSDLGYNSATSPPQPQYGVSRHMPTCYEGGRMGGYSDDKCSQRASKLLSAELPDALSDFILKYSRRYTPSVDDSSSSRKSSFSTNYNSPKTMDSLCNSPLSAGSAPRNSPAAPYGGVTDSSNTPPGSAKLHARSGASPSVQFTADCQLIQQQQKQALRRPAKERLRALIGNEDMDIAWAWTCKFIQESCECLSYQDNGGDTLLHIVVCQPNMDLAKIYALVEQMIKLESEFSRKPFDIPNRNNETPLFLAVEKRHNEVVDYLLEAGASPNTQNSRTEREAPLHYAATRGMVDIVQTLCSYSATNLNMMNGMGLTPLLCAVKNHGVLEEESQSLIDNKATIQLLLKYGADPNITDATNGKSVITYAVERMNVDIIEIFRTNLSEEVMQTLVNKPDFCNETPMANLQQLINVDPQTRSKLGLTLITCGASN